MYVHADVVNAINITKSYQANQKVTYLIKLQNCQACCTYDGIWKQGLNRTTVSYIIVADFSIQQYCSTESVVWYELKLHTLSCCSISQPCHEICHHSAMSSSWLGTVEQCTSANAQNVRLHVRSFWRGMYLHIFKNIPLNTALLWMFHFIQILL